MTAHCETRARLDRRVADLVVLFDDVARTRMTGIPVLNAALRVQAIDFLPLPPDEAQPAGAAALGILLTPWFMNLVWLPLARDERTAHVGSARLLSVGGQRFEFIGAHEPAVGAFAACSLFSPVFEFTRLADAVETARAILSQLRAASVQPPATPARRAFLFGRGAGVAAAT